MKKTILSLALLAASALSVHAGGILDDLKYDLRAGYNIGGTMPMGMPASIRSLDAYRPTLSVMLGLGVYKPLTDKWGLTTGLRLENKGMDIDATVKNYHMEAVNEDGSGKVVGAWTGGVRTKVRNNYLTFPILATYSLGKRWQVSAGPYFSWMFDGEFSGEAHDGYIRDIDPTGTKAEVSRAIYDFSSDLRRFHWGLQAGGEFRAYKHLSVMLNLQWGLNGIFPSDFESVTFDLYPIYATLGFSYVF